MQISIKSERKEDRHYMRAFIVFIICVVLNLILKRFYYWEYIIDNWFLVIIGCSILIELEKIYKALNEIRCSLNTANSTVNNYSDK